MKNKKRLVIISMLCVLGLVVKVYATGVAINLFSTIGDNSSYVSTNTSSQDYSDDYDEVEYYEDEDEYEDDNNDYDYQEDDYQYDEEDGRGDDFEGGTGYDDGSYDAGGYGDDFSTGTDNGGNGAGGNEDVLGIIERSRSEAMLRMYNDMQAANNYGNYGGYSSRSGSERSSGVCHFCDGSGLCTRCGGDGAMKNSYTGGSQECSACGGNKVCPYCR